MACEIKKSMGLMGLLASFMLVMVIGNLFAKGNYYQKDGVAISGYDAVSYFDGEPAEGSKEYSLEWDGVTWHFSSQENLEKFEKNPEDFAPQYGGYCAYGMSSGYTAPTQPDAWTVIKNKLYLNYNKSVRNTWQSDILGHVKKADKNWEKLK